MLHMSTKSQIATATTLLLLLFLTLLTTLPHHRVIQIRGMVRAQVELTPVQRVFVQPYQHPLHVVIRKQKEEILLQQRNCEKLAAEQMALKDLSEFDKALLETDSHQLMYFLETSDKPGLTIRQACAVESAVRQSGRNVILLMTSDRLDVCSGKMLPVLSLPHLLVAHLNTSLLVSKTLCSPCLRMAGWTGPAVA